MFFRSQEDVSPKHTVAVLHYSPNPVSQLGCFPHLLLLQPYVFVIQISLLLVPSGPPVFCLTILHGLLSTCTCLYLTQFPPLLCLLVYETPSMMPGSFSQ